MHDTRCDQGVRQVLALTCTLGQVLYWVHVPYMYFTYLTCTLRTLHVPYLGAGGSVARGYM